MENYDAIVVLYYWNLSIKSTSSFLGEHLSLTLHTFILGVVYAFNVKCSDKVRQLAYDNKVDIVHSNVIYMLVDDLRGRLSHQLPHIEVEETVGKYRVYHCNRHVHNSIKDFNDVMEHWSCTCDLLEAWIVTLDP